jgi:two-component system cell cycle sensor histidine kinase/response regulator CckA
MFAPRAGKASLGCVVPSAASPAATILLVDDDPGVRELLRAMLLAYGYNVIEAASGREALRLSQEHRERIDLLLTDVMMPGMDGPELAAAFSSLRPGTKVLYVSGSADAALDRMGVFAQERHLLLKPFSRDDLACHVREALAGGRVEPQTV